MHIKLLNKLIILFLGLTLLNCTPETSLEGPIEITFGGDGYNPVEMDGYGLANDTHWPVKAELPFISPGLPQYYLDNGSPVAYMRKSQPEISVKGKLKDDLTGSGTITGSSENLLFEGTAQISDGSMSANVKAKSTLPDYIEAWEHESINWKLLINDKEYNLGTTKNSIYVILDEPVMSLLHTPLHIASTAGRGLTDSLEITDRIWQRFEDQEIYRVRDNEPFLYYGLYEDKAPAELRRMLITGSGQCVAWSYLLYSALGTQGITSDIIIVLPSGIGRIFVKNWEFIEGSKFIHTGENGINETSAQGDDVQIIKEGNGEPYARVWKAEPLESDSVFGDDEHMYQTGPNGLVDTKVSLDKAIPSIAYKFGLPNQRAYVLKPNASIEDIQLGGDDVIANQINSTYVLTGPNGIMETPKQDIFQEGEDGKPHPFISWHPELGKAATHINFSYATPNVSAVPEVKGDDIKKRWWINGGENGISDTPGANYKKGKPYSVAVEAGPDGILNSEPGGDDEIIDLADFMENAPEGFTYINKFNMRDLPGVDSQNNDTPPSNYPNHMIVKVGEQYYDPSYGTGPFDTQLEWENESIVGIGTQVRDESGEFMPFKEQIIFHVKPVNEHETITSFGNALPPN